MKILQVINSLNTGGAEKLLLETSPLYVKGGVEMDILLLNGNKYPFKEELENCNCCTVFSLGTGSVYNPLLIFKIIPYLKKYDIVHVHLFPAQYWVVLAKLISFSKIKLLFTEHSTSNRRQKSKVFKYVDRLIYRFFSKIICISWSVKDSVIKYSKLPEGRFEIIENGVNINRINKSKPLKVQNIVNHLSENDNLVMQVSSFQKPKDQPTLIKAMKFLPENTKLLLVGDGHLRKSCENLVRELGLEARVSFLGVRTDISELLKTVDICVLSSHYEGFGLVAVESMASGKPFIGSNVPGLREVVKGAGLLFPKGNVKALVQHITNLLEDKNYYNKVVVSCQERAEQYDISTMVEKHIKLYNSMVHNEN